MITKITKLKWTASQISFNPAWDSVSDSVGYSVRNSVIDSIQGFVWVTVVNSVHKSIWFSYNTSIETKLKNESKK